jgi:cobalt import ATP-binding protein cbiO 2
MTTSREVPISLKIPLNNMENIIEVRNLKYKYDSESENYTLNDVSFQVKKGEWLSIVGHNGSGKSTTVRLIDGLLEAESGDIIISGDKLTAENVWEKRRQIGMVFQNPDNQFVGATVEDDVAFGLENQGLDYDLMVERVQQALELVGMQDFKEREPARLSGGQKQRVAVAGVVALRPDIIILDEATSMLDPEGRLDLIQTVKKIKDGNQLTVISITHDLDEIALSDRVLVMKEGQVESTATPRELFSREDLEELGLDQPFVNQVKAALRQSRLPLPDSYLTEKELQDQLWVLLSKM